MRKLAGSVGFGLCLLSAPRLAAAAGLDGRWIADIPAQGRCNYTGQMNLVVAAGAVSGDLQVPDGHHAVMGTVEADGHGKFTLDHKFLGTFAFRDDHFEATWTNAACERHAAGAREPDETQRTALAAERKRRQAVYAGLIQRAESGDRGVDYAALRAESIYAKDWQFYNSRATSLLRQAAAAVKGKDCAQALDILDQVIKLDFTIDSAHALRAQCLKEAGKPDQARIEDDIAKGLVHSLMDSGKGDSEAGAYVIHTASEEMDVLANRHIQLKTRETQVRGSNGRYYDLVHGVTVSDSDATEAKPRDLYFDITSFVTGRTSRRVAQQVLADQFQ